MLALILIILINRRVQVMFRQNDSILTPAYDHNQITPVLLHPTPLYSRSIDSVYTTNDTNRRVNAIRLKMGVENWRAWSHATAQKKIRFFFLERCSAFRGMRGSDSQSEFRNDTWPCLKRPEISSPFGFCLWHWSMRWWTWMRRGLLSYRQYLMRLRNWIWPGNIQIM